MCDCESKPTTPTREGRPALPRRRFFTALLSVGVAGVGVLQAIPALRMVLYPMLARASGFGWNDLGPLSDFDNITAPVPRTIQVLRTDGWRQAQMEESVYVVRARDGSLQVLSSVCPHLGCAVGWQPQNDRFFCPCHNSVYTPTGALVSGPAQRGMDPLTTSIANNRLRVRFELFQPLLARRVPMS